MRTRKTVVFRSTIPMELPVDHACKSWRLSSDRTEFFVYPNAVLENMVREDVTGLRSPSNFESC